MDFNAAIEAALPRLRRYALKITRRVQDADDLVQDTVLLALRKQHLFRESIHGDNILPWMLTIAHNKNITNIRRAVRLTTTNLEDDDIAYDNHHNAETWIQLREIIGEVERLPPDRRRVLTQIVFGVSYDQVARAEAVPVGTVRSRLSRTRANLRAYLNGEHRP